MNRRAFLEVSGRTMTFAMAAGAPRAERLTALGYPRTSRDRLEERVAAVIRTYDAQGNHRTGSEVDKASAEWLANQVRKLGAEPSLEPFTLNRVDPQLGYLRVGDRRIDGGSAPRQYVHRRAGPRWPRLRRQRRDGWHDLDRLIKSREVGADTGSDLPPVTPSIEFARPRVLCSRQRVSAR